MKIGVDIGGSHIDMAVINHDFSVNILASIDINQNYSFDDFVDFLMQELLKRDIVRIHKLGLAIPGTVDSYKSLVIKCPNLLKWKNLDASVIKRIAMSRGVMIEKVNVCNDANAGAVGIFKTMNLSDQNIIYVVIGTGIGGGAIINNKLLLGANFSAMEIGHTKINRKSYTCGCGSMGCIETFASAKALTNYYNQYNNKHYQNLLSIIQNESPQKVRKLFNRFSKMLALLVSNLIYILDPDLVFIAGKIILSEKLFKNTFLDNLLRNLSMIENYDIKRVVFVKGNDGYNVYNLVGSIFCDEFI
ncbi:MAG: ROK family protein [bacterium]